MSTCQWRCDHCDLLLNDPKICCKPVALTEEYVANAVIKWFPDRAYQAPVFARALLSEKGIK